jgi:hypothetical protein
MNRRTSSLVAAILAIVTMPVAAQWLNVPTKGIPRTKDGKLDLAAPAPRRADGKPDLSGLWQGDRQNVKYLGNLVADFNAAGLPVQPWAEALTRERLTGAHASEAPGVNCLPPSVSLLDAQPVYPLKIIQESDLIVILYELMSGFRQVFLDGRALPTNPNPTWLGYSVGRWESDVLVVDSAGFNGKTWLDGAGHPSTEALHITERFRRLDFGHLDLQLTVDDPKAYTKPWTVPLQLQLLTDTELLEFVCNENERDLKHLVGK